jgi:SAM-dependent methyltransferase
LSPAPDAVAYARAALPPPPARVLEVGAGAGELAATLGAAGYDVTAIDPKGADGVVQVALEDFDAPPRSFDAAVAMVSLHHVVPLGKSLRRLSEVLRHGARLVVDEIAIERYDERAAAWWLGHSGHDKRPADHVAEMREHLHPAGQIVKELSPWFDVHEAVPCAYMYRWHIDPALRDEEEELIASGRLPAVGARFIAVRR